MTARSSWSSRLGFIFAVAGSAVGLANIWRLPYIVGENGGAAFLCIYLLCLLFIGFPVFLSEVLIGRYAQTSPSGAFAKMGKTWYWSWIGKMTIVTGFIVSAFYSAVAAWILGYLFEAGKGVLTTFHSAEETETYFLQLITDPYWAVGFHFSFLAICAFVLYSGVRRGIERGNKILMPMLFSLLTFLTLYGLTLPNAWAGVTFLLSPDWSELTPQAFIIALGQAFFTLSLGQGTMVTYGSYLKKESNLVKSCFPVVVMDTVVSLLAAIAVFTIVFAGGMQPDSGPGLLFHTLPIIFGKLPAGYLLSLLFFFLVLIAAITSQISAMEPAIAYLIDERKWSRHPAVALVAGAVFICGLPCSLSSSVFSEVTLLGMSLLDFISFVASSILIPVGGFFAVVLVSWKWGMPQAIREMKIGGEGFFERNHWVERYFWFCFKYTAPILIVIVFLHALGMIA